MDDDEHVVVSIIIYYGRRYFCYFSIQYIIPRLCCKVPIITRRVGEEERLHIFLTENFTLHINNIINAITIYIISLI